MQENGKPHQRTAQSKGLTTEQFAELCGTTQATISRLEMDKQALTVEWMQTIADALDATKAALIEDGPETASDSLAAAVVHVPIRIRELRLAAGLGTGGLAEMIGITQSGVSRIELGKVATTLDVLHRIAKALDVEPSDLLDGSQIESSCEISCKKRSISVNAVLCSARDVADLISALQGLRSRFGDALQPDRVEMPTAPVISFAR